MSPGDDFGGGGGAERRAPRRGRLLRFIARSPDDQQFADMLNRRGGQLLTDGRQKLIALFAIVVEDANLDQLMAFEIDADLFEDGFRQPVLADGDDGIQGVRACAQGAALFGADFEHSMTLHKERILPSFGP